MSTMYDALRKAEAERKKAEGGVSQPTQPGQPKDEGGIPDSVKTILLLIAVIAVFAFAFYRFKSAETAPVRPVAAPVATAAPAAPVAAVASTNTTADTKTTSLLPALPPQRAPGTYGLDGIINAGDNSMAIVNGKVLKIGEAIDSLVLKKISPKEVELLNTKDNTTVTLKIN